MEKRALEEKLQLEKQRLEQAKSKASSNKKSEKSGKAKAQHATHSPSDSSSSSPSLQEKQPQKKKGKHKEECAFDMKAPSTASKADHQMPVANGMSTGKSAHSPGNLSSAGSSGSLSPTVSHGEKPIAVSNGHVKSQKSKGELNSKCEAKVPLQPAPSVKSAIRSTPRGHGSTSEKQAGKMAPANHSPNAQQVNRGGTKGKIQSQTKPNASTSASPRAENLSKTQSRTGDKISAAQQDGKNHTIQNTNTKAPQNSRSSQQPALGKNQNIPQIHHLHQQMQKQVAQRHAQTALKTGAKVVEGSQGNRAPQSKNENNQKQSADRQQPLNQSQLNLSHTHPLHAQHHQLHHQHLQQQLHQHHQQQQQQQRRQRGKKGNTPQPSPGMVAGSDISHPQVNHVDVTMSAGYTNGVHHPLAMARGKMELAAPALNTSIQGHQPMASHEVRQERKILKATPREERQRLQLQQQQTQQIQQQQLLQQQLMQQHQAHQAQHQALPATMAQKVALPAPPPAHGKHVEDRMPKSTMENGAVPPAKSKKNKRKNKGGQDDLSVLGKYISKCAPPTDLPNVNYQCQWFLFDKIYNPQYCR